MIIVIFFQIVFEMLYQTCLNLHLWKYFHLTVILQVFLTLINEIKMFTFF